MGFRLLHCFAVLCIFRAVLRLFQQFKVFLLAKSGCFLICWSFDQVLQIALGCSGSLWGSFRIFCKSSGCFHECHGMFYVVFGS